MSKYPCISIRQPWAWFIVNGIKNIENRTWKIPQKVIGKPVLIHAGKYFNDAEIVGIFEDVKAAGICCSAPKVTLNDFKAQLGGIVGIATFTDCIQNSTSVWANQEPGTWHWCIANACPLPFHPYKGRLGFFQVDYPHSVAPKCCYCGESIPVNGDFYHRKTAKKLAFTRKDVDHQQILLSMAKRMSSDLANFYDRNYLRQSEEAV